MSVDVCGVTTGEQGTTGTQRIEARAAASVPHFRMHGTAPHLRPKKELSDLSVNSVMVKKPSGREKEK